MEIASAEVNITNANVIFEGKMQQKVAQQERAERAGGLSGLARGGLIYANRGIFVPRGTDTVPAMLTPGEFVVNRSAVTRGNNLQILRAMNNSGRENASGAATGGGMNMGGQVGYYRLGDVVRNIDSIFSTTMPALTTAVASFSSAIDKLTGFSMSVDIKSIPKIGVEVVLPKLEPAIMDIVMKEVAKEIGNYQPTSTGLQKTSSTLSNP
jgi:hypothetical protein